MHARNSSLVLLQVAKKMGIEFLSDGDTKIYFLNLDTITGKSIIKYHEIAKNQLNVL